MYRTMEKSTIHAATVTPGAVVVGSVVLDPDLMDAADLLAGERVTLAVHDTGQQTSAGVVAGVRGSGEVVCECAPGTVVTVTSVLALDAAAARSHRSRSIVVDGGNHLVIDVPDPRSRTEAGDAGVADADPDADPPETPDATRLDALIAPLEENRAPLEESR